MIRSAQPADQDHLLACSAERILVRTWLPDAQRTGVCKLLLRGSQLDAEREVAIGHRLQHLDVVRYLGAGADAVTNRPCVRMEYHSGANLEALVMREGAFGAVQACSILAPVARTLAAMHAMRAPDLPLGIAHGDIKPANLLFDGDLTRLLDFEHAGAIGSGVCAGTPEFAGPEAGYRAPLAASFDVYGLGATLHWLLSGCTPDRGALALQDEELQRLVASCLAADPRDRPAAAEVAARLSALAGRLRDEPLEPVRRALLAGEVDNAEQLLAGSSVDAGLLRDLQQRCRRMRRLLARVQRIRTALLEVLPEEPAPADLTARLSLLSAFLRRCPRHLEAVRLRCRAHDRAAGLLAAELPRLKDLVREEDLGRARAQLRDLRQLVRVALAVPAPFLVPGAGEARMPSLLQRAPLQFLAQEEQRLDTAERELVAATAGLEAALARLALEEAETIVDHVAARLGGTSRAAAQRRDRLHRLGFYVDRIGRSRRDVDRLRELLPDFDPAPLLAFLTECERAAAQAHPNEPPSSGAIGLRSLQLGLTSLIDEFPALRERALPGLTCLAYALDTVTGEAWQLVGEAQHKLQQSPVPVRPLQTLLTRLDTFRTLEALIDRPQQPRSQLIDRIESLRLRLEQAQATRDRMARGAEQALAKGHWTTGLFEMERAVTSLETEGADDNREGARLRQRLAEARKRKQEIETAQRRNVDLLTRIAALEEQPPTDPGELLQLLRERRDCLQFLAVHTPRDRARIYGRDLREVEEQLVRQLVQVAELQIEQATDENERLRLAREMLAQLDTLAFASDPADESARELRLVRERWRERLSAAQREQERQSVAAEAHNRRRRLLTAAGVLVLFLVAGLRLWTAPSTAAQSTLAALRTAAAAYPAAPRAAAERVLALTADAGDPTTAAAAAAWLQELHAALAAFLPLGAPAAGEFAATAWDCALTAARATAPWRQDLQRLEALAGAAAQELRGQGMASR